MRVDLIHLSYVQFNIQIFFDLVFIQQFLFFDDGVRFEVINLLLNDVSVFRFVLEASHNESELIDVDVEVRILQLFYELFHL